VDIRIKAFNVPPIQVKHWTINNLIYIYAHSFVIIYCFISYYLNYLIKKVFCSKQFDPMHFCFKTLYFQPFPRSLTIIVFQLITTDAGIIELGADVYYKVTDAVKSVTNVQDMNATLRALVRNGVMNSLTRHELQYIEAQDLELMQNVRVRRVITD